MTTLALALGMVMLAQPASAPNPPGSPTPTAPATEGAPGEPGTTKPIVPFPHPLITEVLFAVPTGSAGDANRDGMRDAAGDEFVELINPHDKPIQLRGYTLRDRNDETRGGLRFRFPAVELTPGQVVVVFNGFKASWRGPVGDSSRPPTAGNDAFNGSLVFTMRAASSRSSFANEGDWVLLSAPDGRPVQCVRWGEAEEQPPRGTPLIEDVPIAAGRSVQRPTPTTAPEPHPGERFSPGVVPWSASPAVEPPAKPADPPP